MSACLLLRTSAELQAWRASLPPGAALGFVPTMGALHAGHAALVRRARAENDCALVSIFVNALQFDRAEDLERYPRALTADLELCAAAGAQAVYAPEAADVYAPGFATAVEPGPAAAGFEGAYRPGHFRGVLTVVLKLLQRAQPRRAYFGEKDAQQLFLVRQMVKDFDLPVAIVPCATVREPDGLALSSRNRRLQPSQRADALALWRGLEAARNAFAAGERDPARLEAALGAALRGPAAAAGAATAAMAVQVDYAAIVDDRDFAAARRADPGPWRAVIAAQVHGVRLIDNLALGDARA
jgi:pantoate--beta-alanine ligase